MEVYGKQKVRRMSQKQKRIRQKELIGLGRRTREEIYIEKWDQTDRPEIPDIGARGEGRGARGEGGRGTAGGGIRIAILGRCRARMGLPERLATPNIIHH